MPLYQCQCGRPSKTRICRDCQKQPQKPPGMPQISGCMEDSYSEESDADSVCNDTVDALRHDELAAGSYRYIRGKRVRMK